MYKLQDPVGTRSRAYGVTGWKAFSSGPLRKAGMWAWILHRISGLAIIFFLLLHIWEISSANRGGSQLFNATMAGLKTPLYVFGEWLLFLAVVYHGINGIRLILFDLNIGVRQQKTLFWLVLGLSAVLIIAGTSAFLSLLG